MKQINKRLKLGAISNNLSEKEFSINYERIQLMEKLLEYSENMMNKHDVHKRKKNHTKI